MPDLGNALEALFSGGDTTIFKATVDAFDSFQGTVEIHVNGGSFTDVPVLASANYWGIDIGDLVYVIGKQGWGMLCLGEALPSDRPPVGDSSVFTWDPAALARWNASPATWTVPATDEVVLSAAVPDRAAVYFFSPSDLTAAGWPNDAELGSLSFKLGVKNLVQNPEMAVDYSYVTIGLHSSASPAGTFAPMANLSAEFRVWMSGNNGYVTVPLDWFARLMNGTAKGIYVRPSGGHDLTVYGDGDLRVTAL